MVDFFLNRCLIMDRYRPTPFEHGIRPFGSAPSLAERERHDSMTVHCGRCGTLLMLRIDDIKGKFTIDCEECEKRRPVENEPRLTRSSPVSASAHDDSGNGLKSLGTLALLDHIGKPLSECLQRVLGDISQRLRNRFPALGDEVLVTEVLEEAGRRISDYERASGSVQNLDAFAWITVMNVAKSRMRHPSMRLARLTLPSEESQAVFGTLLSTHGSQEQIEADILVKEILGQLTADERSLCSLKKSGLSSREIAKKLRTSVARVNILFHRVKRKIRHALRLTCAGVS